LRVPAKIEEVLKKVKVDFSEKGVLPDTSPYLRKIYLIKGKCCAPDKSEFDMGMREEPMESFAKYTEGVLPVGTTYENSKIADPEKRKLDAEKRQKAWKRINAFVHRKDGPSKRIITNHRVLIHLPWANPSGSMWTTTRNTDINLKGEEACARAAWAKVRKNREFEEFLKTSGYGDDTFNLFEDVSHPIEELWKAMMICMPDIGWDYKAGTTDLTDCISDLEILGRYLHAVVQNDKVVGFVGVRPRHKMFHSLVYPKEPFQKDINPSSIRMARLIMLSDEACFYPQEYKVVLQMFSACEREFKTTPSWAEKYYDPTFNVSYKDVVRPRSWLESVKLHCGESLNVKISDENSGEKEAEEDIDVDLSDFEPIASSSLEKKEKKKVSLDVKEKKKKKKKATSDDEDLDVDV